MASKRKHVRIICPHCTKRVRLAPPRSPFGWLRPVPCPNCHIPIRPAQIKAQLEPTSAGTASASQTGTSATTVEDSAAAEAVGSTASEEDAGAPESDQREGSGR